MSNLAQSVADYLGVSLEVSYVVCGMFLAYAFLGVWGVFRLVRAKPDSIIVVPSTDTIEKLEEIDSVPSKEPLDIEASEEVAPPNVTVAPLSLKLASTRTGIFSKIRDLFSAGPKIAPEMLEEAEYLLVGADVGTKTAKALITDIQSSLAKGEEITQDLFFERLRSKTKEILSQNVAEFLLPPGIKRELTSPFVIMMVGVNGVGKTTTCAKLAAKYHSDGYKVLLVAADTFRAAAVKQLTLWGEKVGVAVHSGSEESKPQAVVFDAMVRAKEENFEVVIVDTAGRLHTKSSLMQELGGVRNSIVRHLPDAPQETLLVVDGSTGQNAIAQAKEFNEAVKLTGLVVTKLDGTPKGGIVVAIKEEFGIPIRFIGVGESENDLRAFDYSEFVEALFDTASPMSKEVDSAHAETRRRKRRAA